MIRGIICCTLGVLTFGIGLQSFWDMKKKDEEFKLVEVESSEELNIEDASVEQK